MVKTCGKIVILKCPAQPFARQCVKPLCVSKPLCVKVFLRKASVRKSICVEKGLYVKGPVGK